MTLGAAGSTTPSTLRGHTRFLTRTNSTKFSDADIDALLNLYYHEFVNELLKAGSDIDFNMVTETINLVADTQTYSVTGKVLKIKRIEITYDGNKPHRFVNFFDINERGKALDTTSIKNDFSKDKPFADIYLATGEVVKIDTYPIADAAVTNGLKVWKILEITELSATTDEPTIPEAYQKYLSYGASKDYFHKQGLFNKEGKSMENMERILARAIEFYARRNEGAAPVLRGTVGIENYE